MPDAVEMLVTPDEEAAILEMRKYQGHVTFHIHKQPTPNQPDGVLHRVVVEKSMFLRA